MEQYSPMQQSFTPVLQGGENIPDFPEGEEMVYGTRDELLAMGYPESELIPTEEIQEQPTPISEPSPSYYLNLTPPSPSTYFNVNTPEAAPLSPLAPGERPPVLALSPSLYPGYESPLFEYQSPLLSPPEGGIQPSPVLPQEPEFPTFSPTAPSEYAFSGEFNREEFEQPFGMTPPLYSPIYQAPPTPTEELQPVTIEEAAIADLMQEVETELTEEQTQEELALPPRPRVAKRKARGRIRQMIGEVSEAPVKQSRGLASDWDETLRLRLFALARRANRFSVLLHLFYRIQTNVEDDSPDSFEKLRVFMDQVSKKVTEHDRRRKRNLYVARVFASSPGDQPDFVSLLRAAPTLRRTLNTAALMVYDISVYIAVVTMLMLQRLSGNNDAALQKMDQDFAAALYDIFVVLKAVTEKGISKFYGDATSEIPDEFYDTPAMARRQWSDTDRDCSDLERNVKLIENTVTKALRTMANTGTYYAAMSSDPLWPDALLLHTILPLPTMDAEEIEGRKRKDMVDMHGKRVPMLKIDVVTGYPQDPDVAPGWPTFSELSSGVNVSISSENVSSSTESSPVSSANVSSITDTSMSSGTSDYSSLFADEDISDLLAATARLSMRSSSISVRT